MLKIIDDGGGQMCNKLYFAAHLLSSSYQRGFDVKYYNFPKYEGILYEESKLEKRVEFFEKNSLFRKITRKIIIAISKVFGKKVPILHVQTGEEALIVEKSLDSNTFKYNKIWWLGWPYLDYKSLRESVSELRAYFRFDESIITEANKFINFNDFDFVCGVHMRRGDYREWREGRYYFSDETYMRVIEEIVENKKRGKLQRKKIAIILFSNEDIDNKKWNTGNNVFISKNSPVVDLYLLSKCDLIVGPPSTFSGWASFVGNTRRFLLDDASKNFSEKDSYVWLTETDGWGLPLKS